jgi:hypothetical protein
MNKPKNIRIMKKYFAIILITAFAGICLSSNTVSAQKREETRLFINRTNTILVKAREAVKAGKVYSGDLVKAIYHQQFAKDLYVGKKYKQAIHHSNRARFLCFEALKNNGRPVTADMKLRNAEKEIVIDLPINKVLDDEIKIPDGTDDKTVLEQKEEDIKGDK